MKKVILSAAVLLCLGTTLVSCKKDYTCKCSKTYTNGSTTVTSDYSTYSYRDTKTKAISRCDENSKSGSDLGGNYSINCDIQ
jgi:hypothetical protein